MHAYIVQIIEYDNNARIIEFNAQNYQEVLGALRLGGSTSFQAAFTCCKEALTRFDDNTNEIVVAFMTDGCDTVRFCSFCFVFLLVRFDFFFYIYLLSRFCHSVVAFSKDCLH
jgi:hypothetical protein